MKKLTTNDLQTALDTAAFDISYVHLNPGEAVVRVLVGCLYARIDMDFASKIKFVDGAVIRATHRAVGEFEDTNVIVPDTILEKIRAMRLSQEDEYTSEASEQDDILCAKMQREASRDPQGAFGGRGNNLRF